MGPKTKKKILLINSLDERYGSTYRARSIWHALRSLGLECTYVESNYREDTPGVISVRQDDSLWGYLRASLRRAVIVLRESCQGIIIQKITPLTFFAIISAFLRGKPLIVDWDDLDAEFQRTPLRKSLTRSLERILAPICRCICTHSKFITTYAKKRGARHVFYLPQVVDTEFFNSKRVNPQKEKARLGLLDKVVFGYAGTFTEGGMRDFDIILSFFKEYFHSGQFFLLIVGGGPSQRIVEDAIREKYGLTNYLITGLIPQESVPDYIAAMDICFIYMRDNIGNRARVSLKLLEYLAMQKVVFGQVVGETKELFGRYVSDFEELRVHDLRDSLLKKQGGLIEVRCTIEEKYSLKAMMEGLKQEGII
ncbi:MAG TPA: glycosyltransferase [Candidatus Margulisiibacteriota bacterium]|nr:glycosyltransferase [Candidatus Margulisiibacteriota bacterium]